MGIEFSKTKNIKTHEKLEVDNVVEENIACKKG
jgi:hypothetical protein